MCMQFYDLMWFMILSTWYMVMFYNTYMNMYYVQSNLVKYMWISVIRYNTTCKYLTVWAWVLGWQSLRLRYPNDREKITYVQCGSMVLRSQNPYPQYMLFMNMLFMSMIMSTVMSTNMSKTMSKYVVRSVG